MSSGDAEPHAGESLAAEVWGSSRSRSRDRSPEVAPDFGSVQRPRDSCRTTFWNSSTGVTFAVPSLAAGLRKPVTLARLSASRVKKNGGSDGAMYAPGGL